MAEPILLCDWFLPESRHSDIFKKYFCFFLHTVVLIEISIIRVSIVEKKLVMNKHWKFVDGLFV